MSNRTRPIGKLVKKFAKAQPTITFITQAYITQLKWLCDYDYDYVFFIK